MFWQAAITAVNSSSVRAVADSSCARANADAVSVLALLSVVSRRALAVDGDRSNRLRVLSAGGLAPADTGGRYDRADAADWYAACFGPVFALATGFGRLGSFMALDMNSGINPCDRLAAGFVPRAAVRGEFAACGLARVSPIHDERIPVLGALDVVEIPDARRSYDAGATFSSRSGDAAAPASPERRKLLPTSSRSDAVLPERSGLPTDPTRPPDTSASRSAKSIDDGRSAAAPIDPMESTINETPSPIGEQKVRMARTIHHEKRGFLREPAAARSPRANRRACRYAPSIGATAGST
jgi:hypothetical protein